MFLKDTIFLTIYLFPTFSVNVYLGLNVEILRSQSWYSFLHPQDLSHASAQHCSLCESHSWMNKQKIFSASFAWLGLAWALSYLKVPYQHLTLTASNTHQQWKSISDYPPRHDIKSHKELNMFWLSHLFFSPHSERGRRGQSWDGGSCRDYRSLMGLALYGLAAGNWGKPHCQ